MNQKTFRRSKTNGLVGSGPRGALARRGMLCVLPLGLMFLAGGAHAQSSGCDVFKATLAARVDPSIRGFTLETVPSSAPVPPGAKVFGNCDGGAYKILFRRGGNTRPAPAEGSEAAAAPASASPANKVVVEAPKPPAQVVQAERVAKPEAAPAPPPPSPPPPPARVAEAAPATTPAHRPEPPVAQRETQPAPAADKVDKAPLTALPQSDDSAAAKPSLDADQTPGFIADNWRWLLALLLLPVAIGLWRWYVYRSTYDEAGLPRGPKIRV
ncbi:MAG: DUF1161 domain-containing protein [Rhizobacter sp.]